jgi:DNA-binding MarR family transcriptional regulator
MKGRRFEHLLGGARIIRHPCDLDLLLFLRRHPCAILTSERLAAYVGYELNQLARSLDRLTDAGLLERSQNPAHAARLYALNTPEAGWLAAVLDIASTREGREELIDSLKTAEGRDAADRAVAHDDADGRVRQRTKRLVAR